MLLAVRRDASLRDRRTALAADLSSASCSAGFRAWPCSACGWNPKRSTAAPRSRAIFVRGITQEANRSDDLLIETSQSHEPAHRAAQPVLRRPAAMPLIEIRIARKVLSSCSPPRHRRSSSTCRWFERRNIGEAMAERGGERRIVGESRRRPGDLVQRLDRAPPFRLRARRRRARARSWSGTSSE